MQSIIQSLQTNQKNPIFLTILLFYYVVMVNPIVKSNIFNNSPILPRCYGKSNIFNNSPILPRCYGKSNIFNHSPILPRCY